MTLELKHTFDKDGEWFKVVCEDMAYSKPFYVVSDGSNREMKRAEAEEHFAYIKEHGFGVQETVLKTEEINLKP